MKQVWFWFRIVLDVAGVLMLALCLFVVYLLFLEFRNSHERELVKETEAVPAYNRQLIDAQLGNAAEWQLVGSDPQLSCGRSSDQHLLQFRHKSAPVKNMDARVGWQRLADNPVLIPHLLTELEKSPCQALLAGNDLRERAPYMWFRLHDVSWWDGQLSNWVIYVYDPRHDTVLIWQKNFPA